MFLFKDSIDYKKDIFRNIRSIRPSQDLFDDLSDDPLDWDAAIQLEITTHPPLVNAQIIQRAFDYSKNDFIDYPFENITTSRYSDGSFPVWYGSETLETSIHETVWHFVTEINDALEAFSGLSILKTDRKVGQIYCSSLAFDLTNKLNEFPWLIDRKDYSQCQQTGKRVAIEGHPLLRVPSARHEHGVNLAVFSPNILSSPREFCRLSYQYDFESREIQIYRGDGLVESIDISR